jgi:hypothetical protein
MDELLASSNLGNGLSIHIATLARATIEEAGALHLGCDGYFLFETHDRPNQSGIEILAKVSSLEAGFRLMDIWQMRFSTSH